ncbi:MAG: acyl-CoA thioesterase [Desulfohalobiaceae bacterium]|nr:acyl-CoA thioesterase [Desulfohalobiaceae bacterium]
MEVFSISIKVRFMDIDAMGHVNHATILSYFAEGRNEFLSGFYEQFTPQGFPFIMAHVSCDFLNPISLGTNLELKVWVSEIRDKSFKLAYKLIDRVQSEVSYAKGESVQIYYDYNQNKSAHIPTNLKKMLERYLE